MTSNLYKVGDWVYCEISPFQPYVIRKIEELTKTPNGNVEAKVLCAFRLHDIPTNVLQSVERYQPKAVTAPPSTTDVKSDTTNNSTSDTSSTTTVATTTPPAAATTAAATNSATTIYFEEHEVADLSDQQRYNLKHREVFYSKYTDTIAATSIRAKCSVLLFNEEVEKYSEYLGKDDSFFYHLTYDPYQKSLVNDKGEIRVGFRFQTEIPPLRPNNTNGGGSGMSEEQLALEQIEKKEANDRVLRSRASLPASALQPEIPILAQSDELIQWCPMGQSLHGFENRLTDEQVDQFVLLTKSVGTFARSLDTSAALKTPSLTLSAANASRDITIQYAMDALHESNYDVGKAALSLVVAGVGPIFCRDESEDWSVAEANLFEDALDKYGKDFNEIRKDYLPWKSIKSIIEYYYMWKTTDRYLQRKTAKVTEQESKLKQVYIPNASKQNQSALIKTAHVHLFQQYDVHLKNSCESCGAPSQSTNQWYAYNPTNLVQQIMNGNANPQALAAAQAQAIANILANQTNPANNPNVSIYQARLCVDCWLYYKKFSLFKYANARQERLNQLKNQVHKCSVNGCGKEFKAKQLLIKHCGIAHGYFAKAATNPHNPNSERPQAIRNRTAFYLLTTPMTRASRLVCTGTVKLKRLAKKPFKLVDLSELNKEWTKESGRNITELLEKRQARVDAMRESCQTRRKLHVKLIDSVAKNRSKLLKSSNGNHNGGTNGHNGHTMDAEDSNDLVIDQANDEDHHNDSKSDQPKPEYFKYFEQKCTTPCYTPDRFAFPKPSADQINKYFLNLMTQNRKRTLEQANNEKLANGNVVNNANSNGQSNDSSDNGPVNKRSLLNNNSNNNNDVKKETGMNNSEQPSMRLALKTSNKPVQSINLPGSKLDEELCYIAVSPIKEVRNQIKMSVLRQLARSPTKSMSGNNQNLYSTVEKAVDSWRQTLPSKQQQLNGHSDTNNGNSNNDNSQSSDAHHHQNGSTTTTTNESASNGKIKSSEQKEVNAAVSTGGASMVVLD